MSVTDKVTLPNKNTVADGTERQPPFKRPKRDSAFREVHEIEFGLAISSRNPQSQIVDSVFCRFCATFGREERLGKRRKSTSNVKFYKRPFRSDNYRSHLESQHPKRWALYRDMSLDAKRKFFERPVVKQAIPVLVSLEGDIETTRPKQPLRFRINQNIVTDIIGELLFDPEEAIGSTKEQALRLVRPLNPVDEGGLDGPVEGENEAVVENTDFFRRAIQFMSLGMSYKLVPYLADILAVTGSPKKENHRLRMAAEFAQIVCAVNLQKMADILSNAWTFSVAIDSSPYEWSFLDVRCRVYIRGSIEDFHLLAVPLTNRHTGDVVFSMISKVLDTLCPDWKKKIIGIATDGDKTKTACIRGVALNLERCALPGFIRIWYGAHRLDHVMQRIFEDFEAFCDDSYISSLANIVSYIRHHRACSVQMRKSCPNISKRHWRSVSKVTKWICDNRIIIKSHVDPQGATCRPSWWVTTFALNKLLLEAINVFARLQGPLTQVSQQRKKLGVLAAFICKLAEMKGPLTPLEIGQLDTGLIASRGRFAVGRSGVRGFVDDLGAFIHERVREMSTSELDSVLKRVGQLLVSFVDAISEIVADCDGTNEAGCSLPPVLPHQLVKLRGRDMAAIVIDHNERLRMSLSRDDVDSIEREHAELCRVYGNEQSLRNALDHCDPETTFVDGWSLLQGRFTKLKEFVGGIATVYPQTFAVESQFSEVNWDKSKQTSSMSGHSLADLSLEGILHSKQWEYLERHDFL